MKLTPEIYFKHVPGAIDMDIRTELYHTNEFTLAVAVILSAQCTDKRVNMVTPELFTVADTPEKVLELGLNELTEYIKSISFFNNKAKSIIGLADALYSPLADVIPAKAGTGAPKRSKGAPVGGINSDHTIPPTASLRSATPPQGGSCPSWTFPPEYHDRDALMKLPGIGQKTANVIMNVLWGAPLIGVDTHIMRNAHRYGWVAESDNTPEKIEKKLIEIIPKKYHAMANHVMVLHGRYICKAIKPLCDKCPVAKWCDAKDKRDM